MTIKAYVCYRDVNVNGRSVKQYLSRGWGITSKLSNAMPMDLETAQRECCQLLINEGWEYALVEIERYAFE
jgi:hypothetical protein